MISDFVNNTRCVVGFIGNRMMRRPVHERRFSADQRAGVKSGVSIHCQERIVVGAWAWRQLPHLQEPTSVLQEDETNLSQPI
jgi:hypothetical protein